MNCPYCNGLRYQQLVSTTGAPIRRTPCPDCAGTGSVCHLCGKPYPVSGYKFPGEIQPCECPPFDPVSSKASK